MLPILHFAYGANMDRAIMRQYAPAAELIGVARLDHYRFVIAAHGYASVEPARASAVYGVLWRITLRDRVALDAWEGVASGHYRVEMRGVSCAGFRRLALIYVAPQCRAGRAKHGYVERVLAAAQAWHLPADHIAALQSFLPPQRAGNAWQSQAPFGANGPRELSGPRHHARTRRAR